MHKFTVRTQSRTELVEITTQVRDAVRAVLLGVAMVDRLLFLLREIKVSSVRQRRAKSHKLETSG